MIWVSLRPCWMVRSSTRATRSCSRADVSKLSAAERAACAALLRACSARRSARSTSSGVAGGSFGVPSSCWRRSAARRAASTAGALGSRVRWSWSASSLLSRVHGALVARDAPLRGWLHIKLIAVQRLRQVRWCWPRSGRSACRLLSATGPSVAGTRTCHRVITLAD